LIQRDICLSQPPVGSLPFLFVFIEDYPNALALFRRQAELFNRITHGVLWRRVLCGKDRACHGEE
jgi:hypothetical protein